MEGVVLAAGEGTRLRPYTNDRPKGLVEVAGRPLLSHVFEALLELGVEALIVVVGYRGDQIVARYGESVDGVPVTYAEQAERRGTAHALATAEPHVEGDFLAMNGDNVYDANLTAVRQRHTQADADATLLVDEVSPERAGRGGVFEFGGEGDVVGLVEKPEQAPSTKVPRGFYAFSPRIFEACRAIDPADTGEYELTDAIDWLVRGGGVVETVGFEGWCRNVNTETDVEAVEQYLQGGR